MLSFSSRATKNESQYHLLTIEATLLFCFVIKCTCYENCIDIILPSEQFFPVKPGEQTQR